MCPTPLSLSHYRNCSARLFFNVPRQNIMTLNDSVSAKKKNDFSLNDPCVPKKTSWVPPTLPPLPATHYNITKPPTYDTYIYIYILATIFFSSFSHKIVPQVVPKKQEYDRCSNNIATTRLLSLQNMLEERSDLGLLVLRLR